jgi:hypothetical protein
MSNRSEIHGFSSLGEYQRFVAHIEDQTSRELWKEVPVDSDYEKGLIYGGRWFKELATGNIWRLVPPDEPFKGLWEKVEKPSRT